MASPGCASGVCDLSDGIPGVCEPLNSCGNSVLEAGEACDDGNDTAGDGCDDFCRVELNFACNADGIGVIGSDGCASGVCDVTGGAPGVCEPVNTCGNGTVEAGEGCDDGNTLPGDGCNALCLVEDAGACNADALGEVGSTGCASGICDATGGAPGICEPALTLSLIHI